MKAYAFKVLFELECPHCNKSNVIEVEADDLSSVISGHIQGEIEVDECEHCGKSLEGVENDEY